MAGLFGGQQVVIVYFAVKKDLARSTGVAESSDARVQHLFTDFDEAV